MKTERQSEFPTKAAAAAPAAAPPAWAPRWLAHALAAWRLRGLGLRINTLERALEGEFALTETAPLHAELQALRAQQAALQQQLQARG